MDKKHFNPFLPQCAFGAPFVYGVSQVSLYQEEKYSIYQVIACQKQPFTKKKSKTVPIYVRKLGDTSYSENGQNERKQKSLCTRAHWDTQLAYTMVLSNV
jgi:hypothetical protein